MCGKLRGQVKHQPLQPVQDEASTLTGVEKSRQPMNGTRPNAGRAGKGLRRGSCMVAVVRWLRALWESHEYTIIKKKLLTITMYILFCLIMAFIYIGWEYDHDRADR